MIEAGWSPLTPVPFREPRPSGTAMLQKAMQQQCRTNRTNIKDMDGTNGVRRAPGNAGCGIRRRRCGAVGPGERRRWHPGAGAPEANDEEETHH